MERFEFKLEDGFVTRTGYRSRHPEKSRDATHEEVVMWQEVQILQRVLSDLRKSIALDVQQLVDKLLALPDEVEEAVVSPTELARLRLYAQDVVTMMAHPAYVRKGVLGQIQGYGEDGSPRILNVLVKREGCQEQAGPQNQA